MKKIKLLLCACMVAGMANATQYYVSPSGDNSDGTSWATAFTSPAAALSKISSGNHEVWVKQGTYTSAARLEWKPGANFYGGFVGTETSRDARNSDPSLTILEGTNTAGVLSTPQTAYKTTWNGFTIQKGKVSGGGGGIFMQRNATLENCIVQDNESTNFGGGGIYVQDAENGAVKIENCIVRNNKSIPTTNYRYGGGIYVKANSVVEIKGCTVEGNISDAGSNDFQPNGGGIAVEGIVTIENCIVQNNKAIKNTGANVNGGGIWVAGSATVANSVIANNFCNAGNGGGIYIKTGASNTSITNCNIVNNQITYASYGGGGVFSQGASTVTNCVFWGNTAPGSTAKHFRTDNGSTVVANCAFDVQTNGTTFNSATVSNTVSVEIDNTGAASDKKYVAFKQPTRFVGNTASDGDITALQQADWSLLAASACIDAGATVASPTTDMLGVARPQQSAYDIGAYEFVDNTPTALNVNDAPSGTGIYSTAGNIVIVNTENFSHANIYDLTGTQVKNIPLREGKNTIPVLSKGIYIVKAGHAVQKVFVK